jgi:hypothetical protein
MANSVRKSVVVVALNKKGGEVSTFFAPNLTMNLTYLCYGRSKVNGIRPKWL